MKKSILVVVTLATVVTMFSCGPKSGPAEKVLSKKVYTQVVNKYEKVGDFVDGISIVRAGWDQYGAINTKGEEVIPANVYSLDEVVEGMIIARDKEYKYGAYNTKGELVVPFSYSDMTDYNLGLSRVRNSSSKYGYVDTSGKEIIAPKYDFAGYSFSEELAVVAVYQDGDYKYGYINYDGEEVIPMIYEDAKNFNEGMAAVRTKNGYGYINTDGELVTAAKYDDAEQFSEGLAVVEKDDRLLVINKEGEELYTFATNIVPEGKYHDGLILVYDTQLMKFGYYNKKGEEAIPFEYTAADGFNDGKALTAWAEDGVCVYKYINKKGKVVGTIDEDTYVYEYNDVEEVFNDCVEMVQVEAEVQALLKNIPADLKEAFSAFEVDKLISSYVQASMTKNKKMAKNLGGQLKKMIDKIEDRYGDDTADSFDELLDELLDIID